MKAVLCLSLLVFYLFLMKAENFQQIAEPQITQSNKEDESDFDKQISLLKVEMKAIKEKLETNNAQSELTAKVLELILEELQNLKETLFQGRNGIRDCVHDKTCSGKDSSSAGNYAIARPPSIRELCYTEDSPVEARGQAEVEIRITGTSEQVQNAMRLFCEKAGLVKGSDVKTEQQPTGEPSRKEASAKTDQHPPGEPSRKEASAKTEQHPPGDDDANGSRQTVSYSWVIRLVAILVESGTGGGFCIWLIPVLLRWLGFQAHGVINGPVAQMFQNFVNAHPQAPLLGAVFAMFQNVGSTGLGYLGMALVGSIGAWLSVSICGIIWG